MSGGGATGLRAAAADPSWRCGACNRRNEFSQRHECPLRKAIDQWAELAPCHQPRICDACGGDALCSTHERWLTRQPSPPDCVGFVPTLREVLRDARQWGGDTTVLAQHAALRLCDERLQAIALFARVVRAGAPVDFPTAWADAQQAKVAAASNPEVVVRNEEQDEFADFMLLEAELHEETYQQRALRRAREMRNATLRRLVKEEELGQEAQLSPRAYAYADE